VLSLNILKYKDESEEHLKQQREGLFEEEFLELMRLLQVTLADTFAKYCNPKVKMMEFT
jgi:hypothetical protein